MLFNNGLLETLYQKKKPQMKRKRRSLNQWQSLMPLFVMTLLPWTCRMIERLPTVSPGSLSYWGERYRCSHTPPGTRSGYRPFCVRYFQWHWQFDSYCSLAERGIYLHVIEHNKDQIRAWVHKHALFFALSQVVIKSKQI